jgi:Fur family ferric uptake transcriptional regulator
MEKRELRNFRKYLERRGLKLTAERRALFDELFGRHEHLEADELLVRLRSKHKKISRATIYRTLDLMVDSGIVGRVRIGEAGYRYERLRAGDHHDHLICDHCGRVIEFCEARIEQLQEEVAEKHGFVLLSHSHQMRGICPRCRPRAKRESSSSSDTREGSPRLSAVRTAATGAPATSRRPE